MTSATSHTGTASNEQRTGWQPRETLPKDDGTYLVTNGRQVAPYIRGIIHNNAGSAWDWNYGEYITHWMPMPLPPESDDLQVQK